MDLMAYINLIWSCSYSNWSCNLLSLFRNGPSVFAGLLVMILLLPLNGFLAAFQRKLQVKQMKHKDERVKMMNEIWMELKWLNSTLGNIHSMSTVFNIRQKEIEKLKQMAYFGCVTTFVWTCAPSLFTSHLCCLCFEWFK